MRRSSTLNSLNTRASRPNASTKMLKGRRRTSTWLSKMPSTCEVAGAWISASSSSVVHVPCVCAYAYPCVHVRSVCAYAHPRVHVRTCVHARTSVCNGVQQAALQGRLRHRTLRAASVVSILMDGQEVIRDKHETRETARTRATTQHTRVPQDKGDSTHACAAACPLHAAAAWRRQA